MDNKPLIAIVGPSGSGKSTSLEELLKKSPPGEVIVLDIEQKGFPFRVNGTPFEKCIIKCDDASQIEHYLKVYFKKPEVKVIIIESFTKWIEKIATMAKATKKGYEIWNSYASEIRSGLDTCRNTQAIIVWTAIPEIVKIPQTDATEKACSRIKVQGKEHEGLIEKEFLIVLYTETKKNAQGKMEYNFITNSDGINSAKTPKYLEFPLLIPNDLFSVIEKLNK